jgi:ABC-type Fe3+/spermidine/putrescine transport system ATPase subunit
VSNSEPLLEVGGLSAAWDGVPVIRSVSFSVDPGEFLVLLGPNGSGKTTLLRCLAGLERPTAGHVRLGGVDITDRPVHTRGIGLMFQESALFAHRTVYENIAYAPLLQRHPRIEVEREVDRVVELLRLSGFEDRRPDQLSGGERQRVALARTLAARPKLVLLDEPFASIDVEVKADLHAEFRRVLSVSGAAAIHVTHDREEGLFLGDNVGLLFDGELELLGAPRAVYENPRTVRAARFLGYNVLPGSTGPVAVHPSDLHWQGAGVGGIAATVVVEGTRGRDRLVVLRSDDGSRVEFLTGMDGGPFAPGTRGSLTWERSVPLRP